MVLLGEHLTLAELGSATGGLQTVLHWFFAKIPPYIRIFFGLTGKFNPDLTHLAVGTET